MKIPHLHHRRHGSVLLTTLVMAMLVGIAVGALLVISQRQNYLTARSRTWTSEIPIAEAGIEEAMAHINARMTTTNLATNGWVKSGNIYVKTRTNFTTEGYYYAAITKSPAWAPPTITSIGYARIPLRTNYTQRLIFVQTKLAPPKFGIVAKQQITMNGNPFIDSYNSSDSDWSTANLYDPLKRSDRAGVGVLSSIAGAINTGGGKVFGSAATGPGGTVIGNVGDGVFLSTSSGLQPDHVTADFNMALPNATLPANFAAVPQTVPILGISLPLIDPLRSFDYVLNSGDWKFPSTSFSGGGVYVRGSVRIWIDGSFSMSGGASVTLAPGATLEMYIGNPTAGASSVAMNLTGHCVINPSGIPANCSIFGFANCNDMTYAGTAAAYCKLYAPNADIKVTGNYDFNGSIVGNYIRFSGSASIHYDEALSGDTATYKVVLWQEM
jgi:hypothetical protein